ncbi:translation initiation factor IF-2-like [Corvus cornix cornix]|uniref:translation initiation factor IF-2-like n=1 Tax=Corvus cornix cornix TaxID=932674 RepID=UPI00195294C0|nr:translation initiation factor IF-2-like [Corvus cornix cornix]
MRQHYQPVERGALCRERAALPGAGGRGGGEAATPSLSPRFRQPRYDSRPQPGRRRGRGWGPASRTKELDYSVQAYPLPTSWKNTAPRTTYPPPEKKPQPNPNQLQPRDRTGGAGAAPRPRPAAGEGPGTGNGLEPGVAHNTSETPAHPVSPGPELTSFFHRRFAVSSLSRPAPPRSTRDPSEPPQPHRREGPAGPCPGHPRGCFFRYLRLDCTFPSSVCFSFLPSFFLFNSAPPAARLPPQRCPPRQSGPSGDGGSGSGFKSGALCASEPGGASHRQPPGPDRDVPYRDVPYRDVPYRDVPCRATGSRRRRREEPRTTLHRQPRDPSIPLRSSAGEASGVTGKHEEPRPLHRGKSPSEPLVNLDASVALLCQSHQPCVSRIWKRHRSQPPTETPFLTPVVRGLQLPRLQPGA